MMGGGTVGLLLSGPGLSDPDVKFPRRMENPRGKSAFGNLPEHTGQRRLPVIPDILQKGWIQPFPASLSHVRSAPRTICKTPQKKLFQARPAWKIQNKDAVCKFQSLSQSPQIVAVQNPSFLLQNFRQFRIEPFPGFFNPPGKPPETVQMMNRKIQLASQSECQSRFARTAASDNQNPFFPLQLLHHLSSSSARIRKNPSRAYFSRHGV